MKSSIFLILIAICFGCETKYDVPETISLHSNWQFKKVSDSVWNQASVPGNVHSDLLENKLIEHPFIGNNEDSLQWISKTNWEYKTTFNIDKKTLQKKHIELNFEGLDTYFSVFLNDSLILKSNNAFREFSVEIKSLLKAKNECLLFLQEPKGDQYPKAIPYVDGDFIKVLDIDGNKVATREISINEATTMSGLSGSNSIQGQITEAVDDNNDGEDEWQDYQIDIT